MPRAVIFDLDDTLYPEAGYVRSGFRAVARWVEDALGIPYDEALRNLEAIFETGDRKSVFNEFLSKAGLEAERVGEMIRAYRDHVPEISFYDGVVDLLGRLRSRKLLLGVLSDGTMSVQRAKVDALGAGSLVDVVVLTDEHGPEEWKPSTRPFQRALAALGIDDPSNAVYVGENSTKDFLGARGAGMHTIRVLEPAGFYTHLTPPTAEHAADLEIRTLAELEAALAEVWPPES